MPKKTPATTKQETALTKALEQDAGAGFENQTSEDIVMPTVWLLQALNPQVVENNPEGSRPGKLMNSVTEELMDDFLFVPATTTHEYVEQVPRDAGGPTFVGIHAINSAEVKRCKATQPFGNYTLENGNELIEHFSVFGVIVDDTNVLSFGVIRFKSTKIKVYKQFNTRMQTCQVPRANGDGRFTPPINCHLIKISTVKQTKKGHDFFNFELKSAVNNNMLDSMLSADDPRYKGAVEARELIASGRATAEYNVEETVDDADKDTPF